MFVLYVEDEPLIQQLVEVALQEAGYGVLLASNGREGEVSASVREQLAEYCFYVMSSLCLMKCGQSRLTWKIDPDCTRRRRRDSLCPATKRKMIHRWPVNGASG